MKEYIKKFESTLDANDYAIVDIPFTSTIRGGTLTNLTCNQENKKIVVDGDNIDIVDDGPEMVDLGLPSGILWAKYNLGVDPTDLDNPEDWYGGYYAWGELEEKENITDYVFSNYRFGGDKNGGQTKYNSTDEKTILDPEDDIVTVFYGDEYSIPSDTDGYELTNNTNNIPVFDYNNVSGLNGYKFVNKNDSSKFIFVPAAGSILFTDGNPPSSESHKEQVGLTANLWTTGFGNYGKLSTGHNMYISRNYVLRDGSYRAEGLSIRPVKHVSQS